MANYQRTLVIGSAFRNSTGYLQRYFSQVAAVKGALGTDWRVVVVAAEGDSVDGTRAELHRLAGIFKVEIFVFDASHGQRWFGSTEEPDRFAALSKVGNAILDGAKAVLDAAAAQRTFDHVAADGRTMSLGLLWYVESDLVWRWETVCALIDALDSEAGSGFDSVSPMPFAGAAFYDIWGFRGLDGERYSPFHPFHKDLYETVDSSIEPSLVEASAVGSGLLMRDSLPRDTRFRMTNGCLVEFCSIARAAGFRFAVNPSLRINHP